MVFAAGCSVFGLFLNVVAQWSCCSFSFYLLVGWISSVVIFFSKKPVGVISFGSVMFKNLSR